MPELAKIQSGLLVDYRARELIDAEHAYISISVGLHRPLYDRPGQRDGFSDTTG